MSHLTVYVAKRFHTMEADLPTATAVGVIDGRIAGVGTLEDLQPWMDAHAHTIDETFADRVVMPGFIDPHIHPSLPAVLTQMPFIAPDPWSLPTGEFPGAATPEEYWALLRENFAAHDRDSGPFFTWGYHPMFHGEITRADLDELSTDVPVVLWHRSFHEVYLNSAALQWAGLASEDQLPDVPSLRECVDLETGHFWEAGIMAVQPALQKQFMTPDRIMFGMGNLAQMIHRGGVTTIADMGTGFFLPPETEAMGLVGIFDNDQTPFRMLLTPVETAYMAENVPPNEVLARVEAMESTGGDKVFLDRHFKLMADGAFFSQAFQVGEPGYIDGHSGEWIAPPDYTRALAKVFWKAGYQLHVHVNGDEGAQFCLDLLQELLDEHPRYDHRFTMEHWGYSTEEQNRRLAVLGGQVSGQPYYVYMLGDKYAEQGLGPDRAHFMSRFGSVLRHDIPLALHSDCPMAPLDPLRLVWAAVNRQTLSGTTIGPTQQLSVEQALRAVTVDAAWILRLENEIGSIRTGKRADFTVLDADPFEVDPQALDSVRPVATVLGGVPFPIS